MELDVLSFGIFKLLSPPHPLTEDDRFQLCRRWAGLPTEADDVEHARQHVAKDGRWRRLCRVKPEESEDGGVGWEIHTEASRMRDRTQDAGVS